MESPGEIALGVRAGCPPPPQTSRFCDAIFNQKRALSAREMGKDKGKRIRDKTRLRKDKGKRMKDKG